MRRLGLFLKNFARCPDKETHMTQDSYDVLEDVYTVRLSPFELNLIVRFLEDAPGEYNEPRDILIDRLRRLYDAYTGEDLKQGEQMKAPGF
jgi:hypothetical protein